MGCIDATSSFHPAHQMDQKHQMDWQTCGPVGRSLSTFAKNKIQRSKPKQGVGFTSNSQHSSSISHLLPPALPRPPAPTSGVQRRCFALLSETLPRRRPGHPSTPHLLLFSAERRPTPHPNQSSFPLLSVCDSTSTSSPSLGHSSLGPHRRPPPRCARCSVVSKGESSEEDYTWRA